MLAINLFKQMKLNFHRVQVYTIDMLVSKLNEQPNLTVVQSTAKSLLIWCTPGYILFKLQKWYHSTKLHVVGVGDDSTMTYNGPK